MLLMLLNDDSMEDAWEYIKKKSHSQGNDKKQIDDELFCLASDCLHGYSTIKRKIKLADIRAAGRRLASLVEDTPLESILLLKMDDKFIDQYWNDVHQAAQWMSDSDDPGSSARVPGMRKHAIPLKEFLHGLEGWARLIDSSEATASHPLYGPRNYFVRYLNQKLEERYKKSMPKFIIPAANVAFYEDINNKKFKALTERSFYLILNPPKAKKSTRILSGPRRSSRAGARRHSKNR